MLISKSLRKIFVIGLQTVVTVPHPNENRYSDIDILVSFEDDSTWGLLELARMKRELKALLGRDIDLLTKKSIEQSHNWIRCQEVLETAQVVYGAR